MAFHHQFNFTLRDLSKKGLSCQVLTLRSSHFRKLNMMGKFMQIHTLNLDFSTSLTSFREDCFSCMPNLTCLSMCETRITNLWTTIAALSKLPSLVELRFQNWLCCNDAGPSAASSDGRSDKKTDVSQPKSAPYIGTSSIEIDILADYNSSMDEALGNLFLLNDVVINDEVQSMIEDSSDDDSDVDFSSHQKEYGYNELLSNVFPRLNGQVDQQNEVNHLVLYLIILLSDYNAIKMN